MDIKNKIKICLKALYDEDSRFIIRERLGLCDNLPDDEYLSRMYKIRIGRNLNLNNPQTFNEKIQWLKLYDRKDIYTLMVDKYLVKDYVANIIGKEYIIPTIGVWDNVEEIDFHSLPDRFVLKCNHNSGRGLCICKDKSKFDINKAKIELTKGLSQNYYYHGREWPYKRVNRKIIAEQYMEDDSGELMDYKLMMFNGVFKCAFTCTERFSSDGLKVTFFDKEWHMMPFERHYPSSKAKIEKPVSYELMIKFAEKLSKNIPFVRVDFYEVKGKPYFGELTFYPGGGMEEFTPEEWDYKLGSWINLDGVKQERGMKNV